jgi:DNA relaxase NicK
METLSNVLVGAFRFVEKVNKNLNLCPTLKFWSEFTSRISRVHLSIKISRKPTTIATKLEWVRRNVAKSLGMLLDAIGWDRLNQILSSEVAFKRSQYTKFDDLAIKEYLLYPGAVFNQDDVFYNMV